MKKLHTIKPNTPARPQHRSFRRFVRKMFASLIMRQSSDCQGRFQQVLEKLQDIEDSIEIIAREMARQLAKK